MFALLVIVARAYEPGSSVLHGAGALLAIAGLVLLVVFAALQGDAWHVVSFTIFGSAMVLLYVASTLYHAFTTNTRTKNVFKRIDHAMIFVLIAGTYTPVCLVTLRGPIGWTLFGIVWGVAIAGATLKLTGVRINKLWSTLLYVCLGWAALGAIVPLFSLVPFWGLFWLFLGGVLYTAGTLFYAMDQKWNWHRWFGAHEIWHLFVMAGTFSHFWFVLQFVL